MYSLYHGQPVLLLRHLNGRSLPAPELRVLCSSKKRAKKPIVPSLPIFTHSLLDRQQSVQKQLPGAHSRTVGPADVELGVPALLADKHFRNIGFPDFGTGQVNPSMALITLYHRAASKWLHAEAGDEVPRVIV